MHTRICSFPTLLHAHDAGNRIEAGMAHEMIGKNEHILIFSLWGELVQFIRGLVCYIDHTGEFGLPTPRRNCVSRYQDVVSRPQNGPGH